MTRDLRIQIEELYTKAIEHRSSELMTKKFKDENQKKLQIYFHSKKEENHLHKNPRIFLPTLCR